LKKTIENSAKEQGTRRHFIRNQRGCGELQFPKEREISDGATLAGERLEQSPCLEGKLEYHSAGQSPKGKYWNRRRGRTRVSDAQERKDKGMMDCGSATLRRREAGRARRVYTPHRLIRRRDRSANERRRTRTNRRRLRARIMRWLDGEDLRYRGVRLGAPRTWSDRDPVRGDGQCS